MGISEVKGGRGTGVVFLCIPRGTATQGMSKGMEKCPAAAPGPARPRSAEVTVVHALDQPLFS